MRDGLHSEWLSFRKSGEWLWGREVYKDESETRVTYFKLSKDTIRCGCVNAVVRGDGTGNGMVDWKTLLERRDESEWRYGKHLTTAESEADGQPYG
jgi:hypothetical protein